LPISFGRARSSVRRCAIIRAVLTRQRSRLLGPSAVRRAFPLASIIAALAFGLAGCSQASVTPAPTASFGASATSAPVASTMATAAPSIALSPAPSIAGGFGFDPESIVGYFETVGYQCTDRRPSSEAEGYFYESCQLLDSDGRTRTLGIVTDPNDDVADAFFSVRGVEGEAILEPQTVLEPFARFLGAVLGEAGGTAALPWLAGALGDAYSTTTLGELTVATYTDSPEDHSKLTVELASRAYLEAPRPSGSPPP
jgi:hypothetical protein